LWVVLLTEDRMGKPIPDSIDTERGSRPHEKGLELPRGPDPRSFDAASVRMNEMMRGFVGLL